VELITDTFRMLQAEEYYAQVARTAYDLYQQRGGNMGAISRIGYSVKIEF
jgi:hypothetical protein